MKYGITMRTTQTIRDKEPTHHHFIMVKGIDKKARASSLLTTYLDQFIAMLNRNPDDLIVGTDELLMQVVWQTPEGQSGDDLALFVDEFEED